MREVRKTITTSQNIHFESVRYWTTVVRHPTCIAEMHPQYTNLAISSLLSALNTMNYIMVSYVNIFVSNNLESQVYSFGQLLFSFLIYDSTLYSLICGIL